MHILFRFSPSHTPNCQTLRENTSNSQRIQKRKRKKKNQKNKNLLSRIFSWVKFEVAHDPVVVFFTINESPASITCQKQDEEKKPAAAPRARSAPLNRSLSACFSPLMFKFAGKRDPGFSLPVLKAARALERGDRRGRRHATQSGSSAWWRCLLVIMIWLLHKAGE